VGNTLTTGLQTASGQNVSASDVQEGSLIVNLSTIIVTFEHMYTRAMPGGNPGRARNNFRIVSGHDDRPNSFLLGHVSFLAGQMYIMNYSFRGP